MIIAGDLRRGSKLLFNNEPYVVVDFQLVKPGKGGTYLRTKMRNLITGLVREETFRSAEKLESPDLESRPMQFLYADDGAYNFMDQQSYEQITLDHEHVEDVVGFLKEQETYDILYFGDRPIAITPPMHMNLLVTEALPGVKGDTAQGSASKPVTLETGMVLNVPLFVEEGDILRIDTRDRSYIERVNKK
ncbi:MAG: Elongation factor P [candidate division TM6 bacterium GW2011_GWE2_41_16]|nr:MAG: Elongation factor P [candidate division TM6 bacterium GW2011_GWE2_41_16]